MRRIVQLLKAFAKSRAAWNLPGGFVISALVAECYQPDFHRDDVALYKTMVAIWNRLRGNTEVRNPVDFQQTLTGKYEYTKQVERFRDNLEIAIAKLQTLFRGNCTASDACSCWNWVFNHPFWGEAVEEDAAELDSAVVAASAPSPVRLTLGSAGHKKPLPWNVADVSRVRLNAFVYHAKKKKLGGLSSDGRVIRSGLDLKYVAKTNAQQPYEVYWQVVNTGRHAESVGGGRGEIFRSKNQNAPLVNWEVSLYTGKHWIECFIVKNGVCVARSGKFYVNIKNSEF
jgi:hypothetical protein